MVDAVSPIRHPIYSDGGTSEVQRCRGSCGGSIVKWSRISSVRNLVIRSNGPDAFVCDRSCVRVVIERRGWRRLFTKTKD